MDEKDKKEKYIKFLFELAELPEAIMGLQVYLLFTVLVSFVEDIILGFIPFLHKFKWSLSFRSQM